MRRAREIASLLRETFSEWQDDSASRLAAALAFYTLFSLTPILLIAIAIASFVFGREAARGEVITQISTWIGYEGAQVVQNALAEAREQSAVVTLIGVATMLFGATVVFSVLQDSLNAIWEVQPKPGRMLKTFVRKRLVSFLVVLGIGFLLLLSLVATAALSTAVQVVGNSLPVPEWLMQTLNFGVSFAFITILFAIIFKVLPDVTMHWSDVWVGAAVTSLLFTIGKGGLGFYLGRSTVGSAYGAAGSFVIFLMWVYYSAQIFFLGAEFTQVYARRYGTRIRPANHAVRVTRELRVDL